MWSGLDLSQADVTEINSVFEICSDVETSLALKIGLAVNAFSSFNSLETRQLSLRLLMGKSNEGKRIPMRKFADKSNDLNVRFKIIREMQKCQIPEPDAH